MSNNMLKRIMMWFPLFGLYFIFSNPNYPDSSYAAFYQPFSIAIFIFLIL